MLVPGGRGSREDDPFLVVIVSWTTLKRLGASVVYLITLVAAVLTLLQFTTEVIR